jgi:hypothetical protein
MHMKAGAGAGAGQGRQTDLGEGDIGVAHGSRDRVALEREELQIGTTLERAEQRQSTETRGDLVQKYSSPPSEHNMVCRLLSCPLLSGSARRACP